LGSGGAKKNEKPPRGPLWRRGAAGCRFALRKRYDPDGDRRQPDVLTPIVDQDDLYTYLTGSQQQRLSLYRVDRRGRRRIHSMYMLEPDGFGLQARRTAFSDRVCKVDVGHHRETWTKPSYSSVHVHGDVHGHGAGSL